MIFFISNYTCFELEPIKSEQDNSGSWWGTATSAVTNFITWNWYANPYPMVRIIIKLIIIEISNEPFLYLIEFFNLTD